MPDACAATFHREDSLSESVTLPLQTTLVLVTGAVSLAAQSAADRPTVIVGATLWDGTGSAGLTGELLTRGAIQARGTAGQLPWRGER
jgi:hypothetical protein